MVTTGSHKGFVRSGYFSQQVNHQNLQQKEQMHALVTSVCLTNGKCKWRVGDSIFCNYFEGKVGSS